jgi:putative transposon-encoded protein
MRIIELKKENLKLTDNVLGFLERTVTPFGTSGKVDCPRKFIGKRVYLIVCKD